MSTPIIVRESLEAVRIVSLPSQLKTPEQVAEFVNMELFTGDHVKSVKIVPMETTAGVKYRSAFVDLTPSLNYYGSLSDSLLDAGKDGVSIPCSNLMNSMCLFTFDNGKPMSHIKVVQAQPQTQATTELLPLSPDDWTSIYIPLVPNDLSFVTQNGNHVLDSEAALSEFFEHGLKIGKVSRIDFMNKAAHGSDRQIRCAYVHFDAWFNNRTTEKIRSAIASRSEYSCNGFHNGFEFVRFNSNRYLNMKVNHKPIPVAPENLNIHQLASANLSMAQRIAELEQEIEALKSSLPPVPLVPLVPSLDLSQVGSVQDGFQTPPQMVREHGTIIEEEEEDGEVSSCPPPMMSRQNSSAI